MLIRFTPAGDAPSLARLIDDVAASPDVGLVVVLACDGNGYTPANVDEFLKRVPKPLVGGIFPNVVLGRRMYEFGAIVAGLACRSRVFRPLGCARTRSPRSSSSPFCARCGSIGASTT